MRDSGSAGGMWVHRLVSGCNQRTKWQNSRASFCVPVAASTAGGHAGNPGVPLAPFANDVCESVPFAGHRRRPVRSSSERRLQVPFLLFF
jgi:hypothetical protein